MTDLTDLWDERDRRYAVRRHNGVIAPLTPAEESSIRAYRLSETKALPPVERDRALDALAAWTPPVIRDFTQ